MHLASVGDLPRGWLGRARQLCRAGRQTPARPCWAARFGPVMLREEIRYRRELAFGDDVVVNVLFGGLSEDGSQWRVQQEVARSGKQAAVLTIDGAWIHLDNRRLVAPPPELLKLLQGLPRARSFEVLRSMVRNTA